MTGTQKTDDVVRKVVYISIESATGPTIAALLGLILANLSANNQWFLIPGLVSSHVYGCSLLYSVNSRKRLVGMMGNVITTNLYRPTTRESQTPPTQIIQIEGTNLDSESLGDQVRLNCFISLTCFMMKYNGSGRGVLSARYISHRIRKAGY